MPDQTRSVARLQFLGGHRIELGHEVLTPEAERLFAMLVRLSVPVGRITSRQTMMDTLWPGVGDANGRHNLRQTVYKAREMGLVVESGEDGLRLDPRHWSADWDDPVGEVPGTWLPGYEPDFSEELQAWLAAQRVGVHALIRPRLIRSLQTARSAGDLVLADKYAVQLLEIDELNEEATLTRAELMAMQGAKVDALRLLDSYLEEIGRVGSGRDAALPVQLLRRRIAEKLPTASYQSGAVHHGPLVGRTRELKRLMAGIFDARAGRGGAMLLHGPEGSGKTRLLHELRKSAVLQGVRVLEMPCDSTPSAIPYAALRSMVARLFELPGAIGISPEAFGVLRAWIASNEFEPGDCPLREIEDLLAAVSEETPLLIQIEHTERIDAESLQRIDRIYRRSLSRYHMLVMTTSTQATPTDSPVELHWVERLSLRPMTTIDVRTIVAAWAAVERPKATPDQVACGAVFAEGVPMYGIEMVGLILDPGSPDVIPWRVQVAVDRALRELDQLQWRVLALCRVLGRSSRHHVIAAAISSATQEGLAAALDALEVWGYVQCEEGILQASALMADGAMKRVKANVLRLDARKAAEALHSTYTVSSSPVDLYSILRLCIAAHEEEWATRLLGAEIGALVRKDTAQSIVFELMRLRREARSDALEASLDAIVDQVRAGAECRRPPRRQEGKRIRSSSLPTISPASNETEHKYISESLISTTLSGARNPDLKPAVRLADAVMALLMASNISDNSAMTSAFQAVNSVRHSPDANPFDICRADVIYHTSMGHRAKALESAKLLAEASRIVPDVQLACKGLRNAAEVHCVYGERDRAQSLLHEAKGLASDLEYYSQSALTDLRLADLCLEEMDIDGAAAYRNSAASTIERNDLKAATLIADLYLNTCWLALLQEDISRAQRAARVVCKQVGNSQSGTTLWAALGVKLATHRGARSQAVVRDFTRLKASIGSRPFYAMEPFSLAALLLSTKGSDAHDETSKFVRSQFPRLNKTGVGVWPFITMNLS